MMMELFTTMTTYSRDFAKKFGDHLDTAAVEYAKKLYEAGISDKQMISGVEAFKRKASTEPFSVNPAEFVALCAPTASEVGMPLVEDAYRECCRYSSWIANHRWSHDAVYLAGRAVGWGVLQTKPEKYSWPIFEKKYAALIDRVAGGESFAGKAPVPMLKVDLPPNKPTGKGRDFIKQLKLKCK